MCLSAGALALCWDTLLGVLSIGGTPQLEAQETMSSTPSDDGAPVFDLLIRVCSAIICKGKLILIQNKTYGKGQVRFSDKTTNLFVFFFPF